MHERRTVAERLRILPTRDCRPPDRACGRPAVLALTIAAIWTVQHDGADVRREERPRLSCGALLSKDVTRSDREVAAEQPCVYHTSEALMPAQRGYRVR